MNVPSFVVLCLGDFLPCQRDVQQFNLDLPPHTLSAPDAKKLDVLIDVGLLPSHQVPGSHVQVPAHEPCQRFG